MKSLRKKKKILNVVSLVLLIIGSFIMLFPFTWMFFTAFKDTPESVQTPPTWFPHSGWHPENFVKVFEMAPFARYFVNTVIVSVLHAVLTLLISIFAAYALSLLRFHGSTAVLMFFIATMMIPGEILIIQNYVTVAKLGWMDTYAGIVIPSLASGMYIYMLRETFMQVPIAIHKAAKMDGCSDWRYLWRVLVPTSTSTLSTIGLLSFIGQWNSYLWPLMVTNHEEMRVLTLGLIRFNSGASTRVNLQMAASLLVVLPIIILFLVFRKKIIEGVASGGIKG